MHESVVHKSVNVRPEVWRRLRLNAELSGTTVRSFLSYLIERSNPVPGSDREESCRLRQVQDADRQAVSAAKGP